MEAEAIIKELPKGIINWYDFTPKSRVLHIVDETCLLQEISLGETVEIIRCNVEDVDRYEDCADFDYVIMVGVFEKLKAPIHSLRILKTVLKPSGKLFLGVDNRLGIRYFCGDRDVFTERNFDSIENYYRINADDREKLSGKAYAKAEFRQMLSEAGFKNQRFYSVLPEIGRPQVLLAEDYQPEEALDIRIFPQYNYPDTVFLEEEKLYSTLIENGLFHGMANGYLIECVLEGEFANARQVTISMDRGPANAMATINRRDGKVVKKAVYHEGKSKLVQLMENNQYLIDRGISMIPATLNEDAFVMPYVKGQPATEYFRELLLKDKKLFLQELQRLWQIICKSSEHVPYEEINWEQFEPGWEKSKIDDPNKGQWRTVAFGTEQEKDNLGIILKRGYIDLVSLNCFCADGEFVFFDQELFVENLPAKTILYRTINFIYSAGTQYDNAFPRKELLELLGLSEYELLWQKFTGDFLNKLRNDRSLATYHKQYRRDMGVIHSNRQRMNFSADEYERIFKDIFRGAEGRKLYLFGSGNFTKKFLSQFGEDYEIAGILDNNSEKWGTELSGIPIFSPKILESLDEGSFKVIVCIKNYVPVIRQLKELGIREYGVFDSNLKYPRKQKCIAVSDVDKNATPKKYHVGYIAGVFDLFHVGHLNMFKRAKEQCDYLIVGVVSDEGVMKNKKTMPYIPFEERIEIVRSCRYVDEAVAIQVGYSDTDEAYRRYQFDVQFSGSDYIDDPMWLAKKAFLQKQGSDLVFFPYTESTSSTKIKEVISKK